MKYNKSEIFKNAWKLRKNDNSLTFGECLRRAWAKAKETIKTFVEVRKENKMDGPNFIEMPYGEYKTHYSHCKTKPGSYNKETKTIMVYVSKSDILMNEIDALREQVAYDISSIRYHHKDISKEAIVELEKSVWATFSEAKTEKKKETLIKNKARLSFEALVAHAYKIMGILEARNA